MELNFEESKRQAEEREIEIRKEFQVCSISWSFTERCHLGLIYVTGDS